MFEMIPAPVKGQPARASWGAALTSRVNELCAMAPARGLARDGLTGTGFAALPSNRRDKKPRNSERPWALSSVKDENKNEHVVIYLPDASLVFDGEIVNVGDIDGITPVEGNEKHYQLEVADGSGDHLVVLQANKGEGEDEVGFSIALAIPDEEPGEDLLASVPIGRIVSGDDKDGYKTVGSIEQLAVGTIVLERGSDEPDEKSVDRNGGEDGENKLQIAHFNDTERDSGKGLEKRLKVDTKTGEVTAEDSEGLMLVGRKDGKVIYIPLTGDGEDPEEEPEEEKPTDPCDHDKGGGKEGGVSPEREEAAGGGGAAGGVSAGGVAGGGEKHKGDDDCNCK